MRVRFASEGDVDWILPELRQFSDESGLITEFFPKSEEEARDIVLSLISDHLFLVAETEDGRGTGFVAGVLTPHALNPKVLACYEMFWWVKREFRRSRAALMLIREYTSYCKENADFATLSLLMSSPDLSKSLSRLGWREVERNFALEVPDGRSDDDHIDRAGRRQRCRCRSGSSSAEAVWAESRGNSQQASPSPETASEGARGRGNSDQIGGSPPA